MAIYPDGNPGEYPITAGTDIATLRALLADTVSVAYAPAEAGYQNYTYFSDDELDAFLTLAGDSVIGAAGYAYISLAASAAAVAMSIKDFDLAVDTTKRSGEYRALGEMYLKMAGLDGTPDFFEIVATGSYPTPAELAEDDAAWLDSGFDFTWRV